MPLFRKHRGSLEDSLKTTIVVKNMAHLKQCIKDDWEPWMVNKDFKIQIDTYYGACDFRCGWYTQLVLADLLAKDTFVPVGYLSEPFIVEPASDEFHKGFTAALKEVVDIMACNPQKPSTFYIDMLKLAHNLSAEGMKK